MFENENGRRREIKKNSCDCDRYVSGCDKCLNYLSAKKTNNKLQIYSFDGMEMHNATFALSFGQ